MGAAVLLAASCIVPQFELVSVGGSAASVAAAGGHGGTDACVDATWPTSPEEEGVGDDDVDFVVAVQTIDFGEDLIDEKGPEVGYNLDGYCSCIEGGPSCVSPEGVTAERCDGPGGIDNASAELFKAIAIFDASLNSVFQSKRARDGEWSLLIHVWGYNGQSNDAKVSVSLHPSPGFDKAACNLADSKPQWDGSDRWPVSAASFELSGGDGGANAGGAHAGGSNSGGAHAGGANSGGANMGGVSGGAGGCSPIGVGEVGLPPALYIDEAAYVSEGRLVAQFTNVPFDISGELTSNPLNLSGGVLSARIDQVERAWHLNQGILVGLWQRDDVFRSFTRMLNGNEPFCTDHQLHTPVQNAVCAHLDLAVGDGDATRPCNAISFGVGFHAKPAQIGELLVTESGVVDCPPERDPVTLGCNFDR